MQTKTARIIMSMCSLSLLGLVAYFVIQLGPSVFLGCIAMIGIVMLVMAYFLPWLAGESGD